VRAQTRFSCWELEFRTWILVKLPRKVTKESVCAWIRAFWDLKGGHEVKLEYIEVNKLIRSLGIKSVVLWFPDFSHGQLYVAISRVTSSANVKIFSGQGPNGYIRNVIYREVLEM
jgi:hypothetical protein